MGIQNNQAYKIGATICIVSSLAISAILCAPQPSSSASSSSSSSSSTNQPSSGSKTASSSLKSAFSTTSGNAAQLSSAASISSGSPSLVNLKSATGELSSGAVARDEMDTFDGKNPFADDSLWQIPVHLVRDLNTADAGSDAMAKSASSESSQSSSAINGNSNLNLNLNNDEDDDDYGVQAANLPAQSSSASPTVISASTDLKTAAGYHYPTSHGHHGYGGHHYGGAGDHYGSSGHHGAEHYGGKYFQYASVPYPHAWEFGYRRGNPYHTIERYEHGKGPHFQTKVKWSDKHGGYGVHVWDYNHDDHHSHHYGGGHHESHEPSHYGGSHHGYGHH